MWFRNRLMTLMCLAKRHVLLFRLANLVGERWYDIYSTFVAVWHDLLCCLCRPSKTTSPWVWLNMHLDFLPEFRLWKSCKRLELMQCLRFCSVHQPFSAERPSAAETIYIPDVHIQSVCRLWLQVAFLLQGFAMLRQQCKIQPSQTVARGQTAPTYVEGYGFVPSSQVGEPFLLNEVAAWA